MTVSAQKFTRQQLLSVHAWSPKLFSLRCTRDPGFRFRAGQFVRLGVRKASGSIIWRAYSVVSAPHDEFLEFFSIVVPGGEFTSELSRLQVGDELLVERQPFGYLTLDRFIDGQDLWLLASGTGLAPFLSILQEPEVWQRFARIVLVYSARNREELAYQELIHTLRQRHYLQDCTAELVYLPLVTGEQVPGTLHGRVTTLLSNGELEKAAGFALEPAQGRVMLCGNPQMLADMRALMAEGGMIEGSSGEPGDFVIEKAFVER